MKLLKSGLTVALGAVLLTVVQGCVVGGGGYYDGDGYYDGGAEVSYGADFYEPYGYDYGGWGPGYRVGPFRGGEHHDRGGDHHPDRGGGRGAPAYRPAAPSRSMPSIPSHSRRR
jgi:hypothetical protein